MTVHELIETLKKVKNQQAEVKLIVGNDLSPVVDVWTNAKPVIIEGEKKCTTE